jgi:3-dehydroquinate dehydratase-2
MSERPILLLLHGPNLNLLGQREPHIYGTLTLADYEERVRTAAAPFGIDVECLQSNHEGVLIDAIHAARTRCAAIVINPGAFTHYAWGLHDALSAFTGPVVEVHISNPNVREPWRHTSVVAPVAKGSLMGFGIHGYELAVQAVARLLDVDGAG